MSEFKCEVVRVQIEPHPNADAIEIAKVGDFQSIVKKGQFNDGDLAVYIPEQAVVPEWLLKEMGMWDEAKQKGGLSGSMGNRVKAIKLRGVLSQGLMLQMDQGNESTGPFVVAPTEDGIGAAAYVGEGGDVAEFLGIVKYEPALPSHMRGKIVGVWRDVFKDPITSSGKKSKKGRLTLVKDRGEFKTMTEQEAKSWTDYPLQDALQLVYENGQRFNRTNLETVRKNTGLW